MNQAEFEAKISQSSQPMVIDFTAAWCAPCRVTGPILKKLAHEYHGKVELLEVNADEAPEVIKHYRIMGIPTVLAFRAGVQAARMVGAQGEANYRSLFESLASGTEIKATIAPFDRMLRLGGGALLVIFGLSMQNWLLVALGGLLAFLGIYDRCPIWQAISSRLKQLKS